MEETQIDQASGTSKWHKSNHNNTHNNKWNTAKYPGDHAHHTNPQTPKTMQIKTHGMLHYNDPPRAINFGGQGTPDWH